MKKEYKTPEIMELGTLKEITQSSYSGGMRRLQDHSDGRRGVFRRAEVFYAPGGGGDDS